MTTIRIRGDFSALAEQDEDETSPAAKHRALMARHIDALTQLLLLREPGPLTHDETSAIQAAIAALSAPRERDGFYHIDDLALAYEALGYPTAAFGRLRRHLHSLPDAL